MMRIMGIDYGDTRIGVAISDPFGWTAQGIETIQCRNGHKAVLERISQLIREYGAESVIVGFPRNMNGSVGPRGEKTLQFIELLKEHTGLPVIQWDERLSTVAANRTMHELGIKTSRKKNVVDQIAAVHILQGYLDSKS